MVLPGARPCPCRILALGCIQLIEAVRTRAPALRLAAAGVLAGATGFLGLGTYYFTKYYWGPAILNRLLG